MIIKDPSMLTTMEIWQPKYSAAYEDGGERVALLAKYKVEHATPVILVTFTKAKHLEGQRFCITKEEAMRYPVDSNGKIPCIAVPMSALKGWETMQEVHDLATNIFED